MSDEIIGMIKSLENTMNEHLNKQDKMLSQLIKVVADNNERLERIENAVNRIKHNEPDDVMSIPVQINKKLDDRDYDLQALNKRVFKTNLKLED